MNIDKERVRSKKYRDENYAKELARSKTYYLGHKHEVCAKTRKYQKDNPGKVAAQKRRYVKNNPWILAYRAAWANNPKRKLARRISNGINRSLRYGGGKGGHWEDIVGYSLRQLSARLRKTMPDGYSWNDFLSGDLHIDHIIPLAVFNFRTPKDLDFHRAWALSNLQLLPAKKNLQKSNKIDRPFQPSLAFGGFHA